MKLTGQVLNIFVAWVAKNERRAIAFGRCEEVVSKSG